MFKKSKTGIMKKILATMLVTTLTFANIILLGAYISSGLISYASGSIDDSTNSNNVKFKVYFKQDDDSQELNQISPKIDETLTLYIDISVKNTGYLNNAKIEFVNRNFEFESEGVKENKINIEKTITTDEGVKLEVPIKVFNAESFNKDLLNMASNIKLTGKYHYDETNGLDIESTKEVTVNWENVDNIEADVTQDIVTNKIYNINGQNKRVLQVLVKSNVTDNKYPIKNTNIVINAPILNDVKPDNVRVISYNTAATNGKTSLGFDGSNWGYDSEQNKVIINVSNTPDENNKISWKKQGQDEFLVTYVYPESVDFSSVTSNLTDEITLYNEQKLTKENTLNVAPEEIGEGITFDITATENVYKGSMYVGADTLYQVNWALNIGYADIAKNNNLYLGDDNDLFNNDLDNKGYYKTTSINKAEMLKVLGEDGNITIYKDSTYDENPININKDSQEGEDRKYFSSI